MELAVYNITGKETGKKVKLNKKVFGAEPNDQAILGKSTSRNTQS